MIRCFTSGAYASLQSILRQRIFLQDMLLHGVFLQDMLLQVVFVQNTATTPQGAWIPKTPVIYPMSAGEPF